MNYRSSDFYSYKNTVPAAAATILYLVVSYFLIGFRTDQLALVILFNCLYFISASTRRFILGFSIFIVYWIIFDYMKAFPNYHFGKVHILDLYNAERSLFGMRNGGAVITPNEYWLLHQSNSLTILAGIFYLCWIPVPLAFAAYLFFTDKKLFLQFSLVFVLVNFIGFIIYYAYPAAPPWYMQLHGGDFIALTPGNTSVLGKFDALTGTKIFAGLYSKSSNVFAAMPSLHSSYPLIVLYYGIKKRMGTIMNIAFAIVMLGIWSAAVYTSHHYVLDVIAGIICAVMGLWLFERLFLRLNFFKRFLHYYLQRISYSKKAQRETLPV